MTAALDEKLGRPEPLYVVPIDEAHAMRRRVLDGLEARLGSGRPNDRAAAAFAALVDAGEHLAACEKVAGLSQIVLGEARRGLRLLEQRLQRQLLARDHGGICPPRHPALPPGVQEQPWFKSEE
jgi:hypothetical protein